MTLNFPGPYELRIFYNVTTGISVMPHVMRLNVVVDGSPAPGELMTNIYIVDRGDDLVAADAVVSTWVNLIKVRWAVHASNVISHAELWKIAPGSHDGTFISTMTVGVAATGSGTTLIAGQEMYVFRTAEGGTMKVNFMQSVQAQGAEQAYTALNAGQKAIVDLILDPTDAFFKARDTSWPVAFTGMFPGSNEALFKKIFRP